MPRFVDNLTIEDVYEIEYGHPVDEGPPCEVCGGPTNAMFIILSRPWNSRIHERFFDRRWCVDRDCRHAVEVESNSKTMSVYAPGEKVYRLRKRMWGRAYARDMAEIDMRRTPDLVLSFAPGH